MQRNDLYKIFQLSSIFIGKYEYNQILIQEFSQYSQSEIWLTKLDHEAYQLIRITFSPASQAVYDKDRIETYLSYLQKTAGKDLNFLDIHVSNEKYDPEAETYDYINVEEGYADGKNVMDLYPEIYTAIHKVDDERAEIFRLKQSVQQIMKSRISSRYQADIKAPYATMIIIGICLLMNVLQAYLSRKYAESAVIVLLGGNYTTFTLGLRQFYRLIVCAFLHGGFLHLFSNMYSLFFLGSYLEKRLGSWKMLSYLLFSVLIGSLSQGILTENTVTVGISAGLYGLMLVFILDGIKNHVVNLRSLLPLIMINLAINFISTTAWIAHLGGLLGAYVLYHFYDSENKLGPGLLLLTLTVCLFIRYLSMKTINPLYGGTDLEVVKILNDLGFKDYSNKLYQRLLEVYQKYGG
ncbi:MAG: rhomboid family intramembrane serine protease [Erysipelotrichaceae bacterium]|nr:rhomboid family intramembrane serine protease [Erysipelotrichaceae bacterium]